MRTLDRLKAEHSGVPLTPQCEKMIEDMARLQEGEQGKRSPGAQPPCNTITIALCCLRACVLSFAQVTFVQCCAIGSNHV